MPELLYGWKRPFRTSNHQRYTYSLTYIQKASCNSQQFLLNFCFITGNLYPGFRANCQMDVADLFYLIKDQSFILYSRVFKKGSPNGKITVYLGRRDFVDHISHVDPIGNETIDLLFQFSSILIYCDIGLRYLSFFHIIEQKLLNKAKITKSGWRVQ